MLQDKNGQKIENNVKPVDVYIPGSEEKKRAIIMYVLIGIMMMLPKNEINVFEYFHLKQATGRWITFVAFFILFAILLFVPVVKYLGIIPLLLLVVLRIYFINQARNGKYSPDSKKSPILMLSGLGGWLLGLFDINPKVLMPQLESTQDEISDDEIDLNKPNIN